MDYFLEWRVTYEQTDLVSPKAVTHLRDECIESG